MPVCCFWQEVCKEIHSQVDLCWAQLTRLKPITELSDPRWHNGQVLSIPFLCARLPLPPHCDCSLLDKYDEVVSFCLKLSVSACSVLCVSVSRLLPDIFLKLVSVAKRNFLLHKLYFYLIRQLLLVLYHHNPFQPLQFLVIFESTKSTSTNSTQS